MKFKTGPLILFILIFSYGLPSMSLPKCTERANLGPLAFLRWADNKLIESILRNPSDLIKRGKIVDSAVDSEYNFGGARIAKFQRARNIVMNFTPLKQFGFNFNKVGERTKYICRLPASAFNGKPCGWEIKKENGDWARLRIDYDENNKAHFNIVMKHEGATYKYALNFDCGSRECTQATVERLRRATFGD